MKALALRTPRALIDLAEIAEYIAGDNREAALRFLNAVQRDCAFLAGTPGAGVPRDFRRRHLAGVRSWPIGGFENYLIFYRPTGRGVEVLRILHGARDIEAALKP